MDFKTELTKIANQIDQVIKEDSFPNTIQPDYLQQAVRRYPCRGGKRLRPALLMWCCGLYNGNLESAKFAAAAVEIYHNWTLVHDDIIDKDDFRRGEPTTHKTLAKFAQNSFTVDEDVANEFGVNFAILAGDIQQGWATNMVYRSIEVGVDPQLVLKISQRLQELVNRDLISGEALDVDFSYRDPTDISMADIELMLTGKTATLLQFCAETGAMLALKDADYQTDLIKQIGEFAKFAGLAFQLRDDWLGIFGDTEKFGKPTCSDMSEAKPTFLLISALTNLAEAKKQELLNFLGQPVYAETEITRIKQLVQQSGAEDINNSKAQLYADKAKDILVKLPNNSYKILLEELCNFLVNREV